VDRAEHMAWCKQRALDELERGSKAGALASMISDLGKHPETESSVKMGGMLMTMQLLDGQLDTPEQLRKFIEGFN
jgi:hypothetical protein